MRVADRLRRLESQQSCGGGMTRAEIEAAAAEFEQKIASMAARPAGMTPEEAMSKWRALITSPNPEWWQRVFANAEPEDWFV